MTTKEDAQRIINSLREKGITDEEIVQAVIGVLQTMEGEK